MYSWNWNFTKVFNSIQIFCCYVLLWHYLKQIRQIVFVFLQVAKLIFSPKKKQNFQKKKCFEKRSIINSLFVMETNIHEITVPPAPKEVNKKSTFIFIYCMYVYFHVFFCTKIFNFDDDFCYFLSLSLYLHTKLFSLTREHSVLSCEVKGYFFRFVLLVVAFADFFHWYAT